jgi:DNA-binding MarR family transcriptional regulator
MKKQYNLKELSKNELFALRAIALGKNSLKEILLELKKSRPQIYRIIKNLSKKEFIEKRRRISLQKHSFISILAEILRIHPQIIPVLSDSGITILKETLEGATIKEISLKTLLKPAIIYRKIKEARKFSILRKKNKKYLFSEKIWPDLKEFLEEYKKHISRIDPRIDARFLIRGKYGNFVIIESDKTVENSSLTAFSTYSDYGIKILNSTNYYHFPKEKLDIRQIFRDSLLIAEDNKEYRTKLYVILFYLKHKKRLKGIKPELISKLYEVLKGKRINEFPTLEEIKEKAKLYDIRI